MFWSDVRPKLGVRYQTVEDEVGYDRTECRCTFYIVQSVSHGLVTGRVWFTSHSQVRAREGIRARRRRRGVGLVYRVRHGSCSLLLLPKAFHLALKSHFCRDNQGLPSSLTLKLESHRVWNYSYVDLQDYFTSKTKSSGLLDDQPRRPAGHSLFEVHVGETQVFVFSLISTEVRNPSPTWLTEGPLSRSGSCVLVQGRGSCRTLLNVTSSLCYAPPLVLAHPLPRSFP